LLVTIAIIVALLAILLPALQHTVAASRGFRCQMSLRGVAFDFSIFADDQLHGSRGDDETRFGNRFYLATFQDSQYSISEFWGWGAALTHTLPDEAENDPMRCAAVRGPITVKRGLSCERGGVIPFEHISFGFNKRLHRPVVYTEVGSYRTPKIRLTSEITTHGMVPLAWDIDGAAASAVGMSPVFSAPGLGSPGTYAGNRSWYPAFRHTGAANFAFIGGHVLSSRQPLAERDWRWSFQPIR
jgi:prepilin-type processing-associated H-X9-DG protein